MKKKTKPKQIPVWPNSQNGYNTIQDMYTNIAYGYVDSSDQEATEIIDIVKKLVAQAFTYGLLNMGLITCDKKYNMAKINRDFLIYYGFTLEEGLDGPRTTKNKRN